MPCDRAGEHDGHDESALDGGMMVGSGARMKLGAGHVCGQRWCMPGQPPTIRHRRQGHRL